MKGRGLFGLLVALTLLSTGASDEWTRLSKAEVAGSGDDGLGPPPIDSDWLRLLLRGGKLAGLELLRPESVPVKGPTAEGEATGPELT